MMDLGEYLNEYKQKKSRIDILEAKLVRQTAPHSHLTAKYGEDYFVKAKEYEEELAEAKEAVNSIERAMQALTDDERKIIELKYFERKKDIIIYSMECPMSAATFYKRLKSALAILESALAE